jgi:hypothetical protein
VNISELSGHTVAKVNTTAAVATTASVMEWLPPILAAIASALAIIWFTIEIVESETFKKFARHIMEKFKK